MALITTKTKQNATWTQRNETIWNRLTWAPSILEPILESRNQNQIVTKKQEVNKQYFSIIFIVFVSGRAMKGQRFSCLVTVERNRIRTYPPKLTELNLTQPNPNCNGDREVTASGGAAAARATCSLFPSLKIWVAGLVSNYETFGNIWCWWQSNFARGISEIAPDSKLVTNFRIQVVRNSRMKSKHRARWVILFHCWYYPIQYRDVYFVIRLRTECVFLFL